MIYKIWMWLKDFPYIFKVAPRIAMKRWYVFRDIPDSFVERCAKDLSAHRQTHPVMLQIQTAARQELQLRTFRKNKNAN